MRIVECYIDCKAKYYYYAKYYQMLFFLEDPLVIAIKRNFLIRTKINFFISFQKLSLLYHMVII